MIHKRHDENVDQKKSNVVFDFSGSKVLVTGSAQGIGLGVATAFAEAGADVMLLDQKPEVADMASDLERASKGTITSGQCDISDRAMVEACLGSAGPFDVVICNAGVEMHTPVSDANPAVDERFESVIGVNVIGTWNVVRAVLPNLYDQGRIVITSSIWGKIGQANLAAYSASKHALIGFTRSIARELGTRGISVNAVCPGWVHTPSETRSLEEMARSAHREPDELLEEILSVQAFSGLMSPRDLAETYLFLGSDAARNITGQTITVDRGELMI